MQVKIKSKVRFNQRSQKPKKKEIKINLKNYKEGNYKKAEINILTQKNNSIMNLIIFLPREQ